MGFLKNKDGNNNTKKEAAKSSVPKKPKITFKEWWARTSKFFRDVKAEMKKVIWPSKKQVYQHTIVVLAVMAFFAIFILLIDQIYNWVLFKLILNIG
ncbi:preprotein translocase subunit SecE [Caldicellulosiruptoraceae bacterium PP1]